MKKSDKEKDILLSKIPVVEQKAKDKWVLTSDGDPRLSIALVEKQGIKEKKVVDFPKGKENYMYLNPSQEVEDVGEVGYSNLSEFKGTIREIFEDLKGNIYGDKTPYKIWLRLKRLWLIAYQSMKGELKEKANKMKAYAMINEAISRLNNESNTNFKHFKSKFK